MERANWTVTLQQDGRVNESDIGTFWWHRAFPTKFSWFFRVHKNEATWIFWYSTKTHSLKVELAATVDAGKPFTIPCLCV